MSLAGLTLRHEPDTFRRETEGDYKGDPAHPHGGNPAVHLDIPSEEHPQSVHNHDQGKEHGSDEGKYFLAQRTLPPEKMTTREPREPDCTPSKHRWTKTREENNDALKWGVEQD